ncbi:uncharacterized protein TEOVI_000296000 [Trypanosoma equiperdum]|uniref:Uncharacterized protein n=3 Tax=Trypanozoon TaxID=39700 RepID=Q38BC0_TRYB2|nr:hypothetical protein, conserved [Trypanosoma brucei gambiense DAL972]XP_822728.1 hypothetical protein, conserved [Trypanosoma brucei brucei TREU927]EAN77900.1 hypothetical protein, conserved [Trypanosoma brucei brucei TREU927]CBH15501.1 hypothetical protein, conserved [Trypanosoma brucei gambiense DAL972]SCU71379.1 hypothetical protein, conserved [Trypanosoma equiperdum]|eukprot:XP_011777765.1 hypothetical protein, conserved [Trypanosoma brucei gambiense DAL972]
MQVIDMFALLRDQRVTPVVHLEALCALDGIRIEPGADPRELLCFYRMALMRWERIGSDTGKGGEEDVMSLSTTILDSLSPPASAVTSRGHPQMLMPSLIVCSSDGTGTLADHRMLARLKAQILIGRTILDRVVSFRK